jgi:hypothetical protein
MSAFSRGILRHDLFFLAPRLPVASTQTRIRPFLQSRFFGAFSFFKSASQATPNSLRTVKLPIRSFASRATATPATTARLPATNYAFFQQLANKGSPTLLYEAPSHFWLILSAWNITIFCWAYAGYNFATTYLHPPEGLQFWVVPAYGVICAFMGGLGMYFALGTTGIVKSIRVIPGRAAAASAAATRGGARSLPPLNLEFKIKRPLPFGGTKTIVSPAEKVTSKKNVYSPGVYESAAQQRARELQEKRFRQERFEYEKENHIMTMPFRQAARGIGAAWKAFKRAFTQDGWSKVKVNGKTYKVDLTGGWALEEGRALARMVRNEE